MLTKFRDSFGNLRLICIEDCSSIVDIKLSELIKEAISFFNIPNKRVEAGIGRVNSLGRAFSFVNLKETNEEVLISVFSEGNVTLYPNYEKGFGYKIQFYNRKFDEDKTIYYPSIEFPNALKEFNELCKFISNSDLECDTSFIKYNFLGKTEVATFNDAFKINEIIKPSELELIAYDSLDLSSSDLYYIKDISETIVFEAVQKRGKEVLYCGSDNKYNITLGTDYDDGYLFTISEAKDSKTFKLDRNFKELIIEFNRVSALIRFLNGGYKNAD